MPRTRRSPVVTCLPRGTIAPMPNIATVFKEEVARVTRKVMRSETAALKKGAGTHRAELSALKRRIQALEQEVRRLNKAAPPARAPAELASSVRFNAKGLASHRQRLELSSNDCGLLLGVAGQSVLNWESGKSKPRAVQMPAIVAFRAMGKRESQARLAKASEGN